MSNAFRTPRSRSTPQRGALAELYTVLAQSITTEANAQLENLSLLEFTLKELKSF